MREKGQTEVAKTLETPVFSRGIEILTEKFQFLKWSFPFGKWFAFSGTFCRLHPSQLCEEITEVT